MTGTQFLSTTVLEVAADRQRRVPVSQN